MEEPSSPLEAAPTAGEPAPKPFVEPPPEINPLNKGEQIHLFEVVIALIGSAAVIAVIFWKSALLQSAGPYVPVIVPTFIALWQLFFKDWHNYKRRWMRVPLIVVVVGAATWGWLYQNQQLQDKALNAGRAQAAQQSQEANTRLFLGSINTVTEKVNELERKLQTKELRDELAHVKSDLEKTRSALAGPPPVSLQLSLKPSRALSSLGTDAPTTEIKLPVGDDGSVHVPFFVYNPEDRPALKGEITVAICDRCKFAREPKGFTKVVGDAETRRVISFEHILSTTQIFDLSADIIPPPQVRSMEIAIWVKCTTCTVPKLPTKFKVHLARDFVRPFAPSKPLRNRKN